MTQLPGTGRTSDSVGHSEGPIECRPPVEEATTTAQLESLVMDFDSFWALSNTLRFPASRERCLAVRPVPDGWFMVEAIPDPDTILKPGCRLPVFYGPDYPHKTVPEEICLGPYAKRLKTIAVLPMEALSGK